MPVIDYTAVRRIVEEFIGDNFSTVLIQDENTRIDVDEVKEYISVTDITADTQQLQLGSQASRVEGAIVIQIYTELGKGTNRGRELAVELTALLSHESFGNFNFRVPEFSSFGQVDVVDYYQHNLTIPYVYAYGAEEFKVC